MNLKALAKKDLKTTAKNTALIIIGSLIVSFGTAVFVLPNQLVMGGLSGISIVLHESIVKFLATETIVTILTWVTFILGFFFLGKSFAMKTLVSTIVYPIFLNLFLKLPSQNVFDGFFIMNDGSDLKLILSALFGGIFIGGGCAITYIGGGSTGGTDIVGFIAAKYIKRLKSSTAIGITDAVIVLLGVVAIKEFYLTLLGILAVFITTIVIDKVFIGSSKSFVAMLVTDKPMEVSRAVIEGMDRTTTIIDSVGGYTGKAMKMLMVTFKMGQYSEFLNIINKIDKNAFVTIHQAHEINGEGWTR